MGPELSIIIVHYRSPALLKMCLNSVAEYPPSMSYEVVVVDSASTSESRAMIAELFPAVQLIARRENTGYPKGVNLGMRASSGRFLLILNPDIIVTPGSIDILVNYLKARPDIGLIGPQLLNLDGSVQDSYFRFYRPITIVARRTWLGRFHYGKGLISDFLMRDTDHTLLQAPDWLMGSALLVSRAGLDAIGYMDERFFMYFEDVDWAKRFWQAGYKVIYYPESKMYHAHKRDSKSKWGMFDAFLNKTTRWHIHSAIKYFWKYRYKTKKHDE